MLRSRSPPCWSCRSFFNLPSSSAATPFEGTKIVTSGEAYSPPQQPRRRPRAGRLFFESSSRSIFLFEHDLFGKPVPTHRVVARGHAFPDHALAPTAGRGDAFAGQPRRVVGCQENGHPRDIFGLAETAQWRHADNLLFEIAAEDAGRDKSLRRGTAGRDGVDANFARAQFLRQAARDRVD